ncbi:molybdopterin biosynthesis protein [Clostridium sp. A1-XYC3]|uniref:Molybdopterin molybdenumtransferase n=1 Tax=Clostridium tanneri TaxID=3037988 RepID=A0ABU4JY77_9CLOT|nr:molybdopterin biosynthesis protein [Clostridium sp. A1-XYC3]MDW8802829.1 molybdopterin biosynthesis protein [Clostridium sp. A1-XYC3]
MGQNIYLSNYELKDAISTYFEKLNIKKEFEELNTEDCNGRVTCEPIYSLISSPFYNCSAMDGIALKAESTIGASEKHHIELKEDKDYIVVDTGDPIPKEYDCVVMVEDLIRTGDKSVKIYKSAVSWQNIRPLGEDIVQNSLIIPSNHKIRPVDIGAMLAGGVNKVKVYKKPVVGIIPTGTELVDPGSELKIGDIIDFNSRVFAAQVEDFGGKAKRYPIVKDDYNLIKNTVLTAVEECDIVLINAGSSAGREDFTSEVINEVGQVFIHGVAIKPGKPVIMGQVQQKPVIGIPGYPVSAYFVMENIVKNLVEKYIALGQKPLKVEKAILSRRVMSSLKYHEFVRMKLGYVGDKLIATPLSRGAGATMSLVRADGILEVDQSIEGIEAGEKIDVKLLKDKDDIKNTIVCIGSHDPIIDVLADLIHVREKGYFLSSAHVGSMGGIMSLIKGETHLAPIHLLDMETGEYNISYIKKYLSNKNIKLIKCVKRIQGLMVQKGNPLGISSMEDIVKKKLKFVNRQRGAGTRLLFDYNLKKLNIKEEEIQGYEREEFTHLSVAAAVASGDADCGLGVYSAAKLMNLDFIPICNEEYDLAIPEEYLELDIIKELLQVIKSEEFLKEIDKLGGYDYSDIGTVI